MLWPLTSANGYIPDVIVNIGVQMQAHMQLVFGAVRFEFCSIWTVLYISRLYESTVLF